MLQIDTLTCKVVSPKAEYMFEARIRRLRDSEVVIYVCLRGDTGDLLGSWARQILPPEQADEFFRRFCVGTVYAIEKHPEVRLFLLPLEQFLGEMEWKHEIKLLVEQ